MAKPRDLKTLLQLVLEYTETEKDYEGLCATIDNMTSNKKITDAEYCELDTYFDNNPAPNYYKRVDGWWWNPGNKPPRLRYLKKHISLN